jgi:hypothetical protein
VGEAVFGRCFFVMIVFAIDCGEIIVVAAAVVVTGCCCCVADVVCAVVITTFEMVVEQVCESSTLATENLK